MSDQIKDPVAPETGKWDHGLCECHKDCGNCMYVFLVTLVGCSCFIYGDIGANLRRNWCFNCFCMGNPNMGLASAFFLRQDIMKIRNIPRQDFLCCKGEFAECWRTCLCGCCVLCQMRHESALINQQATVPEAQVIDRA